MSTTYEIRTNPTYNSSEVYFDGKPCEAVREALKSLKFKWHSIKKCWYGYASDFTISAAINEALPQGEEENTVVYFYVSVLIFYMICVLRVYYVCIVNKKQHFFSLFKQNKNPEAMRFRG